jgi:large subunit ribosomal protein L6
VSRVGKKIIEVDEKSQVSILGSKVTVKGAKGTLQLELNPKIEVKVENGHIVLSRKNEDKATRAMHGLYRALIANMLVGVDKGFEKELEIVGVGYRAQLKGKALSFSLGHSHPVEVEPPAGILFAVDGQKIKISGIEKDKVGQVAAELRKLRAPEPYKGKGIRYVGEVLKRKQGKSVKK